MQAFCNHLIADNHFYSNHFSMVVILWEVLNWEGAHGESPIDLLTYSDLYFCHVTTARSSEFNRVYTHNSFYNYASSL